VGTAGSFTVTATGYPAPTFSVTGGTLPSGLSLNANTGVLSGTPNPGAGGETVVTITASNGVGTNATQSFTVKVNEQPAITSASSVGFTYNTAATPFQFTASGYPAASFSTTSALPTGVTLTSAGVLSGTPLQSGTFTLAIVASNGVGTDATQSFTLTVGQAPTITSAANATFTVGTAGSFTVTATGFPAPTFSVTGGTLPSGLSLNTTSGVISGTPDAGTGGETVVTITASNNVGTAATQSFTVKVNQPRRSPAPAARTLCTTRRPRRSSSPPAVIRRRASAPPARCRPA